MEPVKGGALAALPEKAGRLLEKLSKQAAVDLYAVRCSTGEIVLM